MRLVGFFNGFNGAVSKAAIVAATLALPVPASAVTFGLDFSNGAGTAPGSFDAPLAGGAVTNLTATISGILFDTQLPGTTSFDYDPAINEFTYSGSFPSFTNSLAYAICPPGQCFLEIYPDPDPLAPGDYLAVDKDLNNIDVGTKYVILPPQPIPLPSALGVLGLGLGALTMLAGRRRRAA